ncbi:sensor histidine kinase [Mucilaginibacter sp. KACC 22063]|uniref:sensor histidine kinase n=1 Tax=Mucilaginibacter sp. KACC 22063 TaxID=3025666 RepID=UPI0023661B32|nr:HAMP domain-containing sensor histidine kinase [Mucilaginibacter sp. KACC 22063]WDF56790.1 HAMP domain-containing sensor histidine kinase [Mucilaginibacter sp. KACC 22063]
MKLQFKLALYNTLIKLATIFFTGLVLLFSLEKISYHHISVRLEDKKNEFMKHLSSDKISQILQKQTTFTDYNILKDDYIILRPTKYEPITTVVDTFSTAERTIENSKDTYRILTCKFNYYNHTYLLEVGNTIDAVNELKQTIKGYTLIILAIALVLTLISDFVFTKHLLNPFYDIIENKLIKVNDPLNFDYSKVKTTTQDFNLLDDSINSLMRKISQMFMLEKQFIANVSHELMTPISIITSRLENILVQDKLTEETENKVFASLKTLNRLKAIINSLLLISQIENNQFNKTDVIMINETLTEIEEELEDRLEDKSVELQIALEHQPEIVGNKSLIHTLLFNIINNAIKYNKKGGSITITDKILNHKYALEISDTGIGMDNKEIERAFNRFEKLDNDERDSFGLGLSIVKSIAAFHNIEIDINSVKGQKTSVLLTFKNETQLH